MKKTALLVLPGVLLAGVGIVGSVALAANNSPTNANNSPQVVSSEINQDQEIPDAQEEQALQSQAKITADQAKVAAEAQISGKALSVHLEDENGVVVYNVAIGNQEVKVNAADGSIVKVEASESEHGSTTEQMTTGHGNEPNGVSGSENDAETNDGGASQ